MPKLLAAVARRAQRPAGRHRRDGGGRVSVAVETASAADVPARRRSASSRATACWLTGDGRPPLSRLRRGHRRRRRSGTAIRRRSPPRTRSSTGSGTRRTSIATEPAAELAERLSDRFGGAQAFFCNSGAEANEAALKYARKATGKAGRHRARGLVPRPHARRARRHRPAGEARCVRAARPGAASRRRTTSRRCTRPPATTSASILLEPVLGEGGVDPARAGVRRGRRRPRRASSARCSPSTRCRPASAAPGTFFAFEQLGVEAAPRHAREGARERAADRLPARRRRRAARVRSRRPRLDLRRQPGRRAPPRSRSADRRRRAARDRARERRAPARRSRRAARRAARCAAPASSLGAVLDRPAAQVVDAASTRASSASAPAPTSFASRRRSSSDADEIDQALAILTEVLA